MTVFVQEPQRYDGPRAVREVRLRLHRHSVGVPEPRPRSRQDHPRGDGRLVPEPPPQDAFLQCAVLLQHEADAGGKGRRDGGAGRDHPPLQHPRLQDDRRCAEQGHEGARPDPDPQGDPRGCSCCSQGNGQEVRAARHPPEPRVLRRAVHDHQPLRGRLRHR